MIGRYAVTSPPDDPLHDFITRIILTLPWGRGPR